MEKMKDAVNAAAGGDGIPTRRIAGDAGREYILQTEEDTKAKAALEAGTFLTNALLHGKCHICEHFLSTSMHGAMISICATEHQDCPYYIAVLVWSVHAWHRVRTNNDVLRHSNIICLGCRQDKLTQSLQRSTGD